MCCKSKKNDKLTLIATDLLQKYVTSANPSINISLREGLIGEEVKIFESLFSVNDNLPNYLFRWMPLRYVREQDGYIYDSGFLSCSKYSSFVFHVDSADVACIKIIVRRNMQAICVNDILPMVNDEGEYILQRSLKLKIIYKKRYTQMEFDDFLSDAHCIELTSRELVSEGIQSITLYEVYIAL